MRRLIVLWSLFLLAVCMVRIALPSVALSFAGFDFSFAVAGSLVALALIALTNIFDNIDFRPLFVVGAFVSFCLFVLCLYFPTLGGIRATYVSAMDIFVAFEASFLFTFAALEEKREALPVFTAIALTWQLLSRKFRSAPSGTRGIQTPRYS
jgi:hypothetical protein